MPRTNDPALEPWPLSTARTGEIVVIARWRPTPEGRDTVLSALPALIEASLAEPGCLGYHALTGTGTDEGTIVLIERYADRGALEAHRTSAHFQQLVLETIGPHLQLRDVTVCTAN